MWPGFYVLCAGGSEVRESWSAPFLERKAQIGMCGHQARLLQAASQMASAFTAYLLYKDGPTPNVSISSTDASEEIGIPVLLCAWDNSLFAVVEEAEAFDDESRRHGLEPSLYIRL